ncbi:hypothetical protein B0H14DRAFT_3636061 [Mycena olivaceomarginata]|nr:hypothetical protein B0H14DRAFT_3636061 [Mycena olivaceomarginata]
MPSILFDAFYEQSTSTLPTSNFDFTPPAGSPNFSPGASGPGSRSFSATAKTMFGSRPNASGSQQNPLQDSTAPPDVFRHLAGVRNEVIHGLSSSQKFYPALQAQKAADFNRPGVRKCKDREELPMDEHWNTKPKISKPIIPKRVKQTGYVFVLDPRTKDINRGHSPVPSVNLLVRLDDAGYVQDIILAADDTAADIQTKVLIRFAHVSALAEHGFRLLGARRKMIMDQRTRNLVPKPGISRVLRTIKRVELDTTAIKMALTESNVRGAGPRFKRMVFIAVNPAGPNLPLRGFTYDSGDDLHHDLSSNYSSDSEPSNSDDSDADTTMDDVQTGDPDATDTKLVWAFVSISHLAGRHRIPYLAAAVLSNHGINIIVVGPSSSMSHSTICSRDYWLISRHCSVPFSLSYAAPAAARSF